MNLFLHLNRVTSDRDGFIEYGFVLDGTVTFRRKEGRKEEEYNNDEPTNSTNRLL